MDEGRIGIQVRKRAPRSLWSLHRGHERPDPGRSNAGGPSGRSFAAASTYRWAVRAGVIVLVMLLAGCGGSVDIPANLRTPTVAGVVEEVVRLPDGGVTYHLKDGTTADIASQKDVLLGGEPLVSELLLAGVDPDGRQWVAGVEVGPPGLREGCFFLPSRGRADGEWILTTTGFRLRKSPDFSDSRDSDGNEFGSDRGGFCLDDGGEVTRYEH